VARLLDTAASVLAERGYEAATMTEIAQRAGTSIGAVYQYFPNKEELVRALRSKYGTEMESRWTVLEQATAASPIAQLANQFVDVMVRFMDEHPAYMTLLDAPMSIRRDQQSRDRLRARLAAVFRTRKPALSQGDALRMANVSVQIVKSMNPLYAETKPKDREQLIREYRTVLSEYFEANLS
jgi:AcrR family transcriptional regulator